MLASGKPDVFGLKVKARSISGGHEHELPRAVVRRRPPVGGPARPYHGAGCAGPCGSSDPGPTPGVESFVPGLLYEGFRKQELTGVPIQCVEEPVSIRPKNRGSHLALPLDIAQDRGLCRVPVVFIGWSKLVIPGQTAGVSINSNDAVGKQVFAAPHICLEGRTGVSGAPEDKIVLGIVGAYVPCRSSAGFPGIAAPRVVAKFPRPRNGVELPEQPPV